MKLTILTAKELRAKKTADIEKYIAELQSSQIELNHSISTNKENKTHQVGVIKKAIARAKTVLRAQAGEEK
jgi:ribosomal protein L29